MLEETIKYYKSKFGESKFEQQGYRVYQEYEEGYIIWTESQILFDASYSKESEELVKKLRKLKKGDYEQNGAYSYVPNIVRIVDGWDIHLTNDIANYT